MVVCMTDEQCRRGHSNLCRGKNGLLFDCGEWTDRNGDAIRKAHSGTFRVVGEDHKYYDDDYSVAEYLTLAEAIQCVNSHNSHDEWFFAYDDAERLVYNPSGRIPRGGYYKRPK